VQLSSLVSANVISIMVENAAYQRTLGVGCGSRTVQEEAAGGGFLHNGAGCVGGRGGGDYLEPKSLVLNQNELLYQNYDPIYDSVDRAPSSSRTSWDTTWSS
jgi:hypothetical protein